LRKYKRKSDSQLIIEFKRLYRKKPTEQELAQFRRYKESISLDFWTSIAKQLKKEKSEKKNAPKKHENT